MKSFLAAGCILLTAAASAQRKPGNPLDHLPANIEILTHFGERADISPDNRKIAFMNKSFGDAFTIDLQTRVIRCLTCNVPGAAFLRVMHLITGDYILIGPDHFENIRISRTRDNELWFLSKEPGSQPVKMGQRMSEGIAISKKSMLVAFSVLPSQDPSLGQGSRLEVAEVSISGGTAKLIGKKVVHTSPDSGCRLESQDFYDNDKMMTFTCYEPQGLGSAMKLNLVTGEATNLSKAPGSYNEIEGIFPDGESTLVEADRQCEKLGGRRGSGNIDIWRLWMDGTGKRFSRLTFFNDYEGGKASNPVVSGDGSVMAFQYARTTDPAGVGYGLLLYKFKK